MNYIELKLTLTPNTELNRDLLSALLGEIGFESFVDSNEGLDAYIREDLFSEESLKGVLESLPLPDTRTRYHFKKVEDKNWNEEWEKHFFNPIIIDNRVVIHSSFHENIPDLQYPIVIDPKMAFGTGHHATTSLMVSFLLELNPEKKSFLDMGCGTAVLAILARKKGAFPVKAIDIDSWAYENSLENIRLNHTSDIEVEKGDAALLGKEKYDYLFANINRNILLNDIRIYVESMNDQASLFMSGFYKEDVDAIREECEKHHLYFVSYKEKNNWVAMHFEKRVD